MGQLRSHFHLTLFFPGNVLPCHLPFQTAFPNSGFLMKFLLNETHKYTTPKTFQDLYAKQTINKTVLLNNTEKPILVLVLPLLWGRGGFGRMRASLSQRLGTLVVFSGKGTNHPPIHRAVPRNEAWCVQNASSASNPFPHSFNATLANRHSLREVTPANFHKYPAHLGISVF